MRTDTNYVAKLANNIEDTLNVTSKEIREMSNKEFRTLLKHGYFSRKKYKYAQLEPTDKQMDVLNLHYGKAITIDIGDIIKNINNSFSYKSKSTNRRRYPSQIKKNKAGRYIDARTGKFVKYRK